MNLRPLVLPLRLMQADCTSPSFMRWYILLLLICACSVACVTVSQSRFGCGAVGMVVLSIDFFGFRPSNEGIFARLIGSHKIPKSQLKILVNLAIMELVVLQLVHEHIGRTQKSRSVHTMHTLRAFR
jgi:hypothetical protein